MHLKIERLFRDTIGSVTATSPKPAPSAPDPVVDNISTSSIARIDAWTAGAPITAALLVGVCPSMGATTTTNKGHASVAASNLSNLLTSDASARCNQVPWYRGGEGDGTRFVCYYSNSAMYGIIFDSCIHFIQPRH